MKKLLILVLLLTSFSAFADSHLDFTLSDFCYKQPNVQKRADVYYFPNNKVGISAKSTCVYKDEYGQFSSQGRLKNGVRNGKWIFWYKNGVMDQEQFWVNGVKQGLFTFWHENGEEKAKQVWEKELSRIKIEDDNQAYVKTFYSSLYRVLLFPRKFYEFDAQNKVVHYSPYNGEVLPGYMFTDNGFWDTFRAVFPFFNMMYPVLNEKIMKGLVNM